MRRMFFIVVVIGMVISMAMTGEAADTASDKAMQKLGRGFLNIFDAATEIPGTMMRSTAEDGVASGMTVGTVNGVVNTVLRAVVGVYEVVTFAIPIPADYEPILDDPKFLKNK